MMTIVVNQEARNHATGLTVTMHDGSKGVIIGRLLDFPHIANLWPNGLCVEYAWETVIRKLFNGSRF